MREHMITVRHNAEIAHRLSLLPGKCQNIHGHSIQIELTLKGELNENGILEGLDFGSVKKAFREHIDTEYDHKLLLNVNDSWAQLLAFKKVLEDELHPNDEVYVLFENSDYFEHLPGLRPCPGDPTIENIAMWIHTWAIDRFRLPVYVNVDETNTNGAGCVSRYIVN